MHSDQLYYLIVLSQSSSMNAASQQLHVTPSALSISIKNLENELQMRLLNRTSRGITLTEHGKQIVKIAEVFFSSLQEVRNKAAVADPISGECYIYSVQGVLDNLLPKIICDFYDQFPALHITVDTVLLSKAIEALGGEAPLKYEFALLYTRFPDERSYYGDNCSFTLLTPVKMLAHVHERFPIAHAKSLSFKSLLNYPLIIYNPPTEDPSKNPTVRMLSSAGSPRKIIFESNYQVYQNMVQQGFGIGFDVISPLLSLHYPNMENIHTIILKDSPPLYLGYLTNNDHTLSLAAQTFLDYLIAYIERNDFSNN